MESRFKNPGLKVNCKKRDGGGVTVFASDRGLSKDGIYYITRFEIGGVVLYSKTERSLVDIYGVDVRIGRDHGVLRNRGLSLMTPHAAL